MNEVDVAIIGGGLAGTSAAIALARQGWQAALFEAKTYPHDKVCGEFLSPECAALLEDLGVMPQIFALHPPILDHARITAPDGAEWTGHMPSPGLGLSRYALDNLLAERARKVSAQVHEATAVTDVQGDLDSGFTLTTRDQQTFYARLVIGAHGKRSQLDRALDRPFFRRRQPFVGLKAHFHGPSLGRCVDLHAFSGGYCGFSGIEGSRVNVCLLVREDVFRRVADIEGFVGWMRRQNPLLDRWWADAERISERWLSISQVPFADKAPIERDVLMAGDSAGLIVPLAGDGMAMALGAGMLAADWSARFLDGALSAARLREGYRRAWERDYRARLRLGRALQAAVLRPALLAPGLRLLNAVPALGRYLVAQTRGESTAISGQQSAFR